jgi:uncharacterized damage-inducible protein DinB
VNSGLNNPTGGIMTQGTAPTKSTATLIAELEQETKTTRRVLERVPEGKLSWKPHDKSMSLGQLALHVATMPSGITRILANDTFEVPQFKQAEATSAAELIRALDESLQTARAFLVGLDDARSTTIWRLVKDGRELMAMPRIAVVRTLMLNHWYHHRGQLSVYLRLLNVPLPSIYGPSADENPFVT